MASATASSSAELTEALGRAEKLSLRLSRLERQAADAEAAAAAAARAEEEARRELELLRRRLEGAEEAAAAANRRALGFDAELAALRAELEEERAQRMRCEKALLEAQQAANQKLVAQRQAAAATTNWKVEMERVKSAAAVAAEAGRREELMAAMALLQGKVAEVEAELEAKMAAADAALAAARAAAEAELESTKRRAAAATSWKVGRNRHANGHAHTGLHARACNCWRRVGRRVDRRVDRRVGRWRWSGSRARRRSSQPRRGRRSCSALWTSSVRSYSGHVTAVLARRDRRRQVARFRRRAHRLVRRCYSPWSVPWSALC